MQEPAIVAYGVALPWRRIYIGRGFHRTVEEPQDDSITFGIEAARNAVRMWGKDPMGIGTVISGSISKPYDVGQNARHVATYVGVGNDVFTADIEAGNSGGVQAINLNHSEIKARKIEYGLAVGTDSGRVSERKNDGSGAVAVILGKDDPIATIRDIRSFSSSDLKFFRREGQKKLEYPRRHDLTNHYVYETIRAMEKLLHDNGLKARDFDYLAFSQPSYGSLSSLLTELKDHADNSVRLEQEDIDEKIMPWVRVSDIGDTHNASVLISMASILDNVKESGKNILLTNYSPDLSLSMWLTTEPLIAERRARPTTQDYIRRMITIKPGVAGVLRRVRITRQPRIIATISGVEGSPTKKIYLCRGCKRVYSYETLFGKCLDPDCSSKNAELRNIELPVHARFKSFPPYKSETMKVMERRRNIYHILDEGKVVIVECKESQLKEGDPLEMVTRMLHDEGIILWHGKWLTYISCYRKPIIDEEETKGI